ncbi:MAG: hypothetical protein KUG72_12205 [Pseudomonadales bacterium]|nr:hypothetical protein [Pseudomonadales bacterium]
MEDIEIGISLTIEKFRILLSETEVDYALNLVSDMTITSISDGRSPISGSICFIEDSALLTKMSDVVYILKKSVPGISCVVTDEPRSFFIKLLEKLQDKKLVSSLLSGGKKTGVSQKAQVHPSAVIGESVTIGDGTIISAGCVIECNTSIGCDCIIRANTVIGCAGISLYKSQANEVLRFPHLAGVVIGNNVEIGANCVLVRGTLKNTRIGNDVVIGNLCNIGHGVSVADKVWLSAGTLLGGNSLIEANSTIGIGATIKDNLTIGLETSIGMGAVCTKNTDAGSFLFGNPAKPTRKIKVGPER